MKDAQHGGAFGRQDRDRQGCSSGGSVEASNLHGMVGQHGRPAQAKRLSQGDEELESTRSPTLHTRPAAMWVIGGLRLMRRDRCSEPLVLAAAGPSRKRTAEKGASRLHSDLRHRPRRPSGASSAIR